MKVYIWQKGSLRLGNEECQEVLAALLIACYCAPARAQIDETRVFSTFLHLPNIWPDGCGSWFSSNIWADGCEFWFSINIWSIFDFTNAALGFQSIFGQYLSRLVRPSHFWQILAFPVLVTACFLLKINKWFHTRFPTFLFWLLDGMQRKEGPLQEFPLSAVMSHLSKTNTIDKMLKTWEIKTRWLLTNDRKQNVSSGWELSESFHTEIT